MKSYTLGADPEMFVRRKPSTTKPIGYIVPICGLIGGTKDKPMQFVDMPKGFMYQEDNVAFEVNVPPASSARHFDTNIHAVLRESEMLVGKAGLVLDTKRSAHRFKQAELTSPKAQTIGCDPDMCAYSGDNKIDDPIARPPFDIKDLGAWRFTGGHIHFGWDKAAIDIPEHVMVRLVDALVYLPIIERDKQKARRTKYGLAGLYRPKPYGMEYRTMSNFWLSDPLCVSARAFNLLSDLHNDTDAICELYQDLPIDKVQRCINNSGEGQHEVWNEITKCAAFNRLRISGNFPVRKRGGGLDVAFDEAAEA